MTLNELEQRITALKSEQDKLTAELEKLKAEQAEVKPWRADSHKMYFCIDANEHIGSYTDIGNAFDEKLYSIGNYYRTRALAEQDAKELALRGRIRQLRDALCEGYQFVHDKLNYFIFYCHTDGGFQVDCCTACQSIAEIYFDTKEHAQTACDILNAERNKEDNHDD